MMNKPKFRIRLNRGVPPITSPEFRDYLRLFHEENNAPCSRPRIGLNNGQAIARGTHITEKGKKLLEEWRNSPDYTPPEG